jgi:hypothetical protein
MDKCINFQKFLGYLLDDEDLIEKGTRITNLITKNHPPEQIEY